MVPSRDTSQSLKYITRSSASHSAPRARAAHDPVLGSAQVAGSLDVHCVCPAPVTSWERRAPAQLRKPRWSVALPGNTMENWQCMYAMDISCLNSPLRKGHYARFASGLWWSVRGVPLECGSRAPALGGRNRASPPAWQQAAQAPAWLAHSKSVCPPCLLLSAVPIVNLSATEVSTDLS